MKKRMMAMLLLCVMAFSLVACGGGSDANSFAGTWKLDSMEAEGMTFDKDMLASFGMDSAFIKVADDLQTTVNLMGEEETIQGKMDGNKLVLEADGQTVELVIEGGKLVMDMGEAGKMVFAK